MASIGKIKKVALREIWKHEAKDFTAWLSENIESLNEVLDSNFTVIETEKAVGSFWLDLLVEDDRGNLAIVENQLEKTDHDHLGKVLTYLTNLDAKIAIWISSNPKEEHVNVIDWLNESTPGDIGFYLVKVEAIRIENCSPAPLFTVVSAPTDEFKEIGMQKKEYAERHLLRKEFWTELLEKANKKTRLHANVKPKYDHWLSAGAGKAGIQFNYLLYKDGIGVEVYIDKGDKKVNEKWFGELSRKKRSIEKIFGRKLSWQKLEDKRAARVRLYVKGPGLNDKESWDKIQNKLIDLMVRLEKAFKPHISQLK